MPPGRKRAVPGEIKDQFKCTLCSQKFTLISTRNRHIKNVHKAVSYCTICQITVESGKDAGKEHAFMHTTSAMACGCCHWVWENQKDLRVHRKAMGYHGFPGMVTPIIRTELKSERACHPRFSAQRQKALREKGQPDAVVSVQPLPSPKPETQKKESPEVLDSVSAAIQSTLQNFFPPTLLQLAASLPFLYLLSLQSNPLASFVPGENSNPISNLEPEEQQCLNEKTEDS